MNEQLRITGAESPREKGYSEGFEKGYEQGFKDGALAESRKLLEVLTRLLKERTE